MKLDKVYEAEIALGETSSTGDPEGEISKNEDFEIPNEGEVLNAISKFTGKIILQYKGTTILFFKILVLSKL